MIELQYRVYAKHIRDDQWHLAAAFTFKDDADEWAYSIERDDDYVHEVRDEGYDD